MNPNKLSSKETSAMRKRYGYWAFRALAALFVLFTVSNANALIQPRYYPTLSIRNYQPQFYPDGTIRVPRPTIGGERYFLVPIFIYNEVDTTRNPNIGGQHLEPIRSFQFQMTYFTQAMVLDTQKSHGSPVVTIGDDPTLPPALAEHFFFQVSDNPDPGDSATRNPFRHKIRISAASSVPLPLSNLSDSSGILLYLRFKVVQSNITSGLLQLDSSLFNDHYGDSLDNPLSYRRGNFGGGGFPDTHVAAGQGLVTITDQPGFLFRPSSQITSPTGDNINFQLVQSLVYDPTVTLTAPIVGVQVSDAVGLTSLRNINVCSDQPWLTVSVGPTPGAGAQCVTPAFSINYLGSFGSEVKNLWISASGAPGLQPGIYFGYITLTSYGAYNSPARILVKLLVFRHPNEPTPGNNGTGIRLTLTNGCTPSCSSTITFGTGPGATSGIDPLYGETIFTVNDSINRDTNVVQSDQCYAYFAPLDTTADPRFSPSQHPEFRGTLRDIRSDMTDTTLLYKVVFKPGKSQCYPVTVCVNPVDFPAGGRIIAQYYRNGQLQFVDLRSGTANGQGNLCFTITDATVNSFIIQYTPGTVGTIPSLIANGWNLVSLPVRPADPSATSIFPHAGALPYLYRADVGWQQANTLKFGRGYMIKYGSYLGGDDHVHGILSDAVTLDDSISIDAGWNTVGALSHATGVSGVQLVPIPGFGTPPNLVSDVFEFTAQHGYDQVSYMLPGKGYFIKSDRVGFYTLSLVNPPPHGKLAAGSEALALEGSLSRVIFSDAQSNAQSLYFGSAHTSVNEARFELPPGIHDLDARFASNRGMISLNKNSYVVNLTARQFPVNMSFSNVAGEVTVRDMNGNVLGAATDGSTVTLTNSSIKQIEISMKQTAGNTAVGSYALEQNYPNPFNPTNSLTSISYTVPVETPVSLKVYNQLGEVVKTLVNDVVSAGRHEVVLDASNFASGTYVYTIVAGNFTKTVRMVLTK